MEVTMELLHICRQCEMTDLPLCLRSRTAPKSTPIPMAARRLIRQRGILPLFRGRRLLIRHRRHSLPGYQSRMDRRARMGNLRRRWGRCRSTISSLILMKAMGRRASRVPSELHQVFFGGVVGLFCSLDLCPVLPDCPPDDERQMPNKETKLHILFEGTFFFLAGCKLYRNRESLATTSIIHFLRLPTNCCTPPTNNHQVPCLLNAAPLPDYVNEMCHTCTENLRL